MTTEASQEPKQLEKKRKRNKVVKLSVHKNTLKKKLKQEQKVNFQEYFKSIQSAVPSPTGFAIVAWDEDNRATAFILDGDVEVFAEKIKFILTREINKYLDSLEEESDYEE